MGVKFFDTTYSEMFQGGVGEKAVRNVLSLAVKVADRSLPLDSDHLKKLSGDIQVGN